MYVSSRLSRRALFAVVVVAIGLAGGGCGGGSSTAEPLTRVVRGPGFTFEAPSDRQLTRTPRSVTVVATPDDASELESVTRFPLVKVFKPSLWPKARAELDGIAERLTASVGGEYTRAVETVSQDGLRGRRYEMTFERDGRALVQRLTLLLGRRTEYQLLCRWAASRGEPAACSLLERSFALVRR